MRGCQGAVGYTTLMHLQLETYDYTVQQRAYSRDRARDNALMLSVWDLAAPANVALSSPEAHATTFRECSTLDLRHPEAPSPHDATTRLVAAQGNRRDSNVAVLDTERIAFSA